jgi:hypothetical protein
MIITPQDRSASLHDLAEAPKSAHENCSPLLHDFAGVSE